MPSMCQAGPGLNGPTAPTKVLLVPSMSHTATVPLLLCHRMSDLLSLLKSCDAAASLVPRMLMVTEVGVPSALATVKVSV